MPFSFTNKTQGDLIRSQDWNAAMTAIVALYDKINGATGHRHTGGVEDGPQIGSAGLQDLAVLTQKLADLCVTTAKLADAAVTSQKIANFAVGTAQLSNGAVDINKMGNNSVGGGQIVNGAITAGKIAAGQVGNSQLADLSVTTIKLVDQNVTTAKIADNAITTAKVLDGAITTAKLANGVAPQIGVATTYLYDGQTCPIPSGFVASECIFYVALDWISHSVPAGQPVSLYLYTQSIDSNGTVTFYNSSNFTTNMRVRALTIAKKGGW